MRASLLTLHRLPDGYRVLYTGILAFFAVGYAAGLLQQELRSGLSPAGIGDWYLGNEDDPAATAFLFPKERHEILDAVWRRGLANLLPAVVLLALLARASAGRWARWGLAVAIGGCAMIDLASPVLVRYGGRAWAAPALIAQTGLAVATLAAALLCWREMWLEREAGPRFRVPTP